MIYKLDRSYQNYFLSKVEYNFAPVFFQSTYALNILSLYSTSLYILGL